jgi:hypothetical protein
MTRFKLITVALVLLSVTLADSPPQGYVAENAIYATAFVDPKGLNKLEKEHKYTSNITETTEKERGALWKVLNQIHNRTQELVRLAEIAYHLQQIEVMRAQINLTVKGEEMKIAEQLRNRGGQLLQKAAIIKSLSQAEVTIESLTGRGYQVPADSCDQILMKLDPASESGLYYIKDKKTNRGMKVFCQMERDHHNGGFLRVAHRNGNPALKTESSIPFDQDFNVEKLAYDEQLKTRPIHYMNLDRFDHYRAFDVMANVGGSVTVVANSATTPKALISGYLFPDNVDVTIYLRENKLD